MANEQPPAAVDPSASSGQALDEVERAYESIPKGPWTLHDPQTLRRYGFEGDADAIATILNALPGLLNLAREAAELREHRQEDIWLAVRGAYRPSNRGTACTWCNVKSTDRITLGEFAGWMHREGCPVPGTIPERQEAIRAHEED